MSTYADPDFEIHTAMGQWLTLIAYHIADDTVIPWDLPNAAKVLREYFEELNETIADAGLEVDTAELEDALDEFAAQADNIKGVAALAETSDNQVLLAVVNSKYRDFARGYVSQGGLPGRPTFRNVLSAPGIDNGEWCSYSCFWLLLSLSLSLSLSLCMCVCVCVCVSVYVGVWMLTKVMLNRLQRFCVPTGD